MVRKTKTHFPFYYFYHPRVKVEKKTFLCKTRDAYDGYKMFLSLNICFDFYSMNDDSYHCCCDQRYCYGHLYFYHKLCFDVC